MRQIGAPSRSHRQAAGATAPRRDPAPSRWSYRMQRLWLTPSWRFFVRYGLPVAVIAAIGGGLAASDTSRGAIAATYAELRAKFESRPEFRVTRLEISGAAPELADAVRLRLGVDLPASSFDIDLEALRVKAEELDAVKSARLAIRSRGTLEVALEERVPVAVWRQADGLQLIDITGHRVAGLIERTDRDDLPLVAGEGANEAVAEALQLMEAAATLGPRLRGLVRMGERRWDLVLSGDLRILLPQEAPVAALDRLLALDQAEGILSRDLAAIDLRLESRPTLRLSAAALARQAAAAKDPEAGSEQDL